MPKIGIIDNIYKYNMLCLETLVYTNIFFDCVYFSMGFVIITLHLWLNEKKKNILKKKKK